MKGKAFAVVITCILLFIIGGGIIFYQKAETVSVAAVYLPSQAIQAKASNTFHEDSIKNNWIQIKDAKGNIVQTTLTRINDSLIESEPLPVGSYTVHINKKAINNWYVVKKEHVLNFEVIETITAVRDEKTLLQYFQLAYKEDEQTVSIKTDLATGNAEMEQMSISSKVSDDQYSGTNNQVDGIEESDIAVTDGKIIYSIRENEVILTEATATNLKIASKIYLSAANGYIESLLLHENYLIVSHMAYPQNEDEEMTTKLTIYDVSNPNEPKLVREFGQEGYRIAIRKIDNILYLVSSYQEYMYEAPSQIEKLQPAIYDSAHKKDETFVPIENISILPAASSTTYTIISALNLSSIEQSEVKTEAYLGSAAGFYMSHHAMYVTAQVHETVNTTSNMIELDRIIMPMEPKQTMIYRYNLDGQTISFSGMATIDGSILNQFSMDEYENYFRVATTKNLRSDQSTSGIIIFDEKMNEVGRIEDLAKGERIYSARFIGNRAFIVTFKEVDPLFTFDLSNPTNPKVLGELKIPGFSTYLHPIGEGHLLGIGQNTEQKKLDDEAVALVQNGIKLALFDIRDLTNPKEQDVAYIAGEGSYSPALYDHHALFIHPELSLYGLPVEIYDYSNTQMPNEENGALLYKITAEQGIEQVASLMKEKSALYTDSYRGTVQRMLYINDSLYVIKNGGISAYDLFDYELQSEITY